MMNERKKERILQSTIDYENENIFHMLNGRNNFDAKQCANIVAKKKNDGKHMAFGIGYRFHWI